MSYVDANGAKIPALGFGTFGMKSGETLRMLPTALRSGFRHIDTAQVYGNEAEVGASIVRAGLNRADVFVTTKVWVANYPARRFMTALDESLRRLRSSYVDLLLLHWPNDDVPLADQLGSLAAAVSAGKVRHVGVSNFNARLLDEAIRLSPLPLVTNQVEYHPYLRQATLLAQTRRANMALTAYCAMAVGRVFGDPTLIEIAARHHKTVAQIVLRWLVQQDGVVALSRTTNEQRVAHNAAIFDFALPAEDMNAIAALARPHSRIVSPPGLAPDWDSH